MMIRKVFLLTLFLGICTSIFSQNSLNGYKYVLVPKKFDFLKSENQYQLNDLTIFLFKKNNFTAIYEDDLPSDYTKNNCLGLKADVKDKRSLLSTLLTIELRDCRNNIVFTSEVGRSKEKDFKKGHHDALRKAFKSFEGINYVYEANENEVVNEVVNIETVPKATENEVVLEESQPATVAKVEKTELDQNVLYAQPVSNGFQLIDNEPKVIYVLQRTSLENVFLLKNRKGLFLKKNNSWVIEYYNESGQLIQKEVKVKF